MGKGKGRKNEEERENARPSSSLLERALVIRTETVSSTKEGTFDRKFTGPPMVVSWSKQLRLIFRREILSFPFLSLWLLDEHLNTTRCVRSIFPSRQGKQE